MDLKAEDIAEMVEHYMTHQKKDVPPIEHKAISFDASALANNNREIFVTVHWPEDDAKADA